MRKPILILYPIGAYGTFIEWLLTYLTDQTLDDQLPFGKFGNAHKFRGNTIFPNLRFPSDRAFDSHYSGFSKTHPGHLTAEQEKSFFSSTILINVPPTSTLWILRNQIEKINFSELSKLYSKEELLKMPNTVKMHNTYDGDEKEFEWIDNIKKYIDHNIFKQYNVNNVEDLERWQLREIFSYWSVHQTVHQLPSNHPDNYQISVEDLKDQMPTVINKIIQKLKLNVVLDRHKKLDYIWQEWKSKQEYVNMDSIVDNYVKNVISGIDQTVLFSFNICEEIVIQQKLREAGYEIKCDGLDRLPLRTNDMKELIYHA